MKRNDLMTHLVDWRGQMFGIRFGLWWITLRGPKRTPMFSERYARGKADDGSVIYRVPLLAGWRIMARKNPADE